MRWLTVTLVYQTINTYSPGIMMTVCRRAQSGIVSYNPVDGRFRCHGAVKALDLPVAYWNEVRRFTTESELEYVLCGTYLLYIALSRWCLSYQPAILTRFFLKRCQREFVPYPRSSGRKVTETDRDMSPYPGAWR
jgi:hypothetical protein